MYTAVKTKYVKKEVPPLSREDEKKKVIEERWLKARRSSTEQSIMDAGRQANEPKKSP